MGPARVLPRLVRTLWRARGRLDDQRAGLAAEIATAVDTLIEASTVARAALRAYRLAMRVLLVVALLLLAAGLALAIGLRDSSLAIVLGILIAAGGVVLGWYWWVWSIGLRWLRANVDPARRVPPGELPGRFVHLADEARPRSADVAGALDELAQLVRDRR